MPSLTGITALDVGIGLAFVFLLLSLLCAAAMEAIAGLLDMRAAMLERGLRNLLDDDGRTGFGGAPVKVKPVPPAPTAAGEPPAERGTCGPRLSDEVLGHGLIRTQYQRSRLLFRRKRRGPSYLPARMVALALLDVVAPEKGGRAATPNLTKAIGDANIPQGTKNALLALAKDAGGKRDRMRELVEDWFDAGMGRVSGWYKRRSQVIVCALSLFVVVVLNVNAITIADVLVRDDVVRAAVVTEATKAVAEQDEAQAAEAPAGGVDAGDTAVTASTVAPADAPADARPGADAGAAPPLERGAEAKDPLNDIAGEIHKVKLLGLPIGWEGDLRPDFSEEHILRTLGGWLITFLALSLGAPFWFDALSRLAGLRSAGARPKPAPAAATERPAVTGEQSSER